MQQFLRYGDGLWPNALALSYVTTGYVGGWFLIGTASIMLNIIGTILLAHAMVIAAYLIHECAHNTIFKNNQHNALLGKLLGWFTGSCYGRYEDIRHKHFRHHVDRADVVAFDYRTRITQYPKLLKLFRWLEWAYIPAIEIMMHLLVIVLPFVMQSRRQHRFHVFMVLLVRGVLFAMLAWWSPRILLFYPLAYMLMMTVLRFMDTHQHTYEVFETLEQQRGDEAKQFDRDYEHRNTFSNLLSVKYPWLNLLVLNFGYHNAHHVKPTVPWHRLPALHYELFGDDRRQLLPFKNLLMAYHQYRVSRVLNADEPDMDVYTEQGRHFIGVDGVNFLTAH